jgi:hypothetical protein
MMPYRVSNESDDAIQFVFDTKAGEVMFTVAHVVDEIDDGETNVSVVIIQPDGTVLEVTAHGSPTTDWDTHDWRPIAKVK